MRDYSTKPEVIANGKRIAVIGGGITGLMTAKKFIDAGYQVDIYEASHRHGGKIESRELPGSGGERVNMGAEFIDSSQTMLIALCRELGVTTIPATDQKSRKFILPDSRMMDAESFFRTCQPIYEQIRRDKATLRANPHGKLALYLDHISLREYLNDIKENLVKEGVLGPTLAENLVRTIEGAFVADNGRGYHEISALQYVNEASAKIGKLVISDCGFRAEGGMIAIVDKLESYLRGRGAVFHTSYKVTSVGRGEDGLFSVDTGHHNGTAGKYDRIAFALTAPALSRIEGLESIGLSKDDIAFLKSAQYTRVTKFSIKTKQPVDDATTFFHHGMECWRQAPNTLTFLIGDHALNSLPNKEIVRHCMEKYAEAQGKTVDQLFAADQVALNGINAELPCHAAPAPRQFRSFIDFRGKAKELTKEGIVIAGTYMPYGKEGNKQVGFVECGVRSAHKMSDMVIYRDLVQEQQPKSFVKRVESKNSETASPLR